VLVEAGGNPYLPLPTPGPYVPASSTDVVSLAPGESIDAVVDLSNWRQAVPGTPLTDGRPLSEETGRMTARVRWSGFPGHLDADNPAPRTIASARRRYRE
jgi:hypothetical protein